MLTDMGVDLKSKVAILFINTMHYFKMVDNSSIGRVQIFRNDINKSKFYSERN